MIKRTFVLAAAAAAFAGFAPAGSATAFNGIADLAPSPVVKAQYTRQGHQGSPFFQVGPNNLRGDRPRGGDGPRPGPDARPDRPNRDYDRRRADRRNYDRRDYDRYYRGRYNHGGAPRWRGPRRYYEGRYWRPAYDGWYVYNDGAWIAAGALGLAAGALLGSAITSQPPATVQSGAPVTSTGIPPWTPAWYTYCSRKYKSFNPQTGLYLGYDGKYHYCR